MKWSCEPQYASSNLLKVLFSEGNDGAIFAQKVQKLKAGFAIEGRASSQIEERLKDLVKNGACRAGARSFADKYANFRPGEQLPEIADRLEKLIRQRR